MLDFIGNLLGGAIGAGGSVAGAQISANEAMQANQANIQQAQWMATGQYLPGLVASAQKAGINPLAALGIHTPGFGASIPADSGRGVAEGARQFAQAFLTPHDIKMRRLDEDIRETQLQQLNAQNTNLMTRAAVDRVALEGIRQGRWVPPGVTEPASTTGFGIPQVRWMENAIYPIRPQTSGPPGVSIRPGSFAERFDPQYLGPGSP